MTRGGALLMAISLASLSACGGPPAAGDGSSLFTPVATVDQVMDAIVIPSSQALTEAARRAEQAADAQNVDLMLHTGSDLYVACTNCHEKYLAKSR